MIAGGNIVDLVDRIDLGTIHVKAPSSLIFLCGGKTDVTQPKPVSLREAFTRIYTAPDLRPYHTIMPEDFRIFPPHGQYKDILSFETEFAEIVDLVILFSESNGSFTELGAFAMIKEIAERLLVVIDDESYNADSFIRLGPVLFLQNNIGQSSICVVNRSDINIRSIRDVSDLNLGVFENRIVTAINTRKSEVKEPSTFDPERPGHVIKLVVGLIQHYSALTFPEIETLVGPFQVNLKPGKLDDYLLCAINAEWIKKDRRGFVDYYCAVPNKGNAIEYKLKKAASVEPRDRWRAQISEYWKAHDDARFSVIQAALKGAGR
ncbi:MAG: hypothetical protein E5X48_31460 [Mesorhizobium sp.]|uniref:retron St85 family effector protein n=1 Tax=Mesorhizobium sp. TaxID=1871066 RepID=UPI00120869FB|nr:retron St85 family effector protein [Mesorhizobium sp.]TIQ28391.1 MAG: hypothetical protein E5X48_31460 [Mesorhizobium sp.]